jgi:hypothetical protein
MLKNCQSTWLWYQWYRSYENLTVEHRAQGTGHRTQGRGHRAQGKGHRAKGTGRGQRAESREQRAQGTGHRAESKEQERKPILLVFPPWLLNFLITTAGGFYLCDFPSLRLKILLSYRDRGLKSRRDSSTNYANYTNQESQKPYLI